MQELKSKEDDGKEDKLSGNGILEQPNEINNDHQNQSCSIKLSSSNIKFNDLEVDNLKEILIKQRLKYFKNQDEGINDKSMNINNMDDIINYEEEEENEEDPFYLLIDVRFLEKKQIEIFVIESSFFLFSSLEKSINIQLFISQIVLISLSTLKKKISEKIIFVLNECIFYFCDEK